MIDHIIAVSADTRVQSLVASVHFSYKPNTRSFRTSYPLIPQPPISEEEEEREWDAIVSKPHVRDAIRRMAREARRQYYAGETEEGGWELE